MKFTFQPESKPLDGYTIKRAIDRGGFGEVYYALSDSGKEVALKLLQRNMDIELRGIRQCMNLKHPNLMTIFDIKTDADGDHWVIMEYMAGKTLEQVLDEHPHGMPMEEVLRWLDGIAAGSAYLHDRGVVHRDLKPANLFIDGGVVKIGDIGLSKYITPSRRSGHTESVGTVHYMAPEVAHGRYGNELDVYSTAIMVYEMITGRVPFDGESTGEIIMKHLTEKPDLSRLPEKLRPIVDRALEKDPNQRTHSIAQFARQIREAVLGVNGGAMKKQPTVIPDESFAPVEPSPDQSSSDSRSHRPTERYAGHCAKPVDRGRRGRQHHAQRTQAAEQSGQGHSIHNLMWILLGVIAVVAVLGPAAMFRSAIVVGVVGGIGYFLYWLFFVPFKPSGISAEHEEKLRREAEEIKLRSEAEAVKIRGEAEALKQRAAPPPQVVPVPKRKKWRKASSVALTPLTIRPVNFRDRMAAATQSMTLAVLFALPILAVVAFLLPVLQNPAEMGLFGFTAILAAWAVLFPAKLWEGSSVEPLVRRMALLCAGILVGILAYGVDQVLMVDVANLSHERWQNDAPFSKIGDQQLFFENDQSLTWDTNGAVTKPANWAAVQYQPTLAGYVVFFATLFGLRRWWWHADAFRPKRFRVSSLLLTGLVGFLITCIFTFPHGWAALWAVVISAIVQLSATWAPPHARAAMMEGN